MNQTASIDLESAARGFAAAGSESRLQVLQLLVRAGREGLPINEIQQRTGIPASTLAHHLKFLAAAELIRQEKHGRTVVNRADYDHIEALAAFLLHACCADVKTGDSE